MVTTKRDGTTFAILPVGSKQSLVQVPGSMCQAFIKEITARGQGPVWAAQAPLRTPLHPEQYFTSVAEWDAWLAKPPVQEPERTADVQAIVDESKAEAEDVAYTGAAAASLKRVKSKPAKKRAAKKAAVSTK